MKVSGAVSKEKESLDLKRLQQSADKDPRDVLTRVALGKEFLQRKEYHKAIKWFERALVLEPGSWDAVNGLARAFFKLGLFYSANKYFKASALISPLDADARKMLRKIKLYPASEKLEVSFYLPCYNAERYISKCLEGVISQSYPIQEILVIDDGSTDQTAKIAYGYPVKVISHKNNLGLSFARNIALRHAKGEYVASVDADVVPDKYWLEYLMMNFYKGQAAGVGGKLLEQFTLTVVDRWRQVNMRQNFQDRAKENSMNLFGCDTVFRKKCLDQVGGYNERFKNNHEDTDLGNRIKMLGFKLFYEPRAIARHLRTDNLQSLLNTYWHYHKATRGELQGFYTDFRSLKLRINYNLISSLLLVSVSMNKKRTHLLYPDIIFGFRNILRDIIHAGQYSKLPVDLVAETFLATLAGFRYSLKQKKGVSDKLIKYFMEDLSDLTDFLPPKYKPYLSKMHIFSDSAREASINNYRQIKSVLSFADFKFSDLASKLWSLRFNFDPQVWKMAEISAQRIRYESKIDLLGKPGVFKVMLLNPPWRKGKRCGVRAGSRWPFTMDIGKELVPGYLPFPFFLAYATSFLKKDGINAVIVDAIGEGLTDGEFLERVRGFSPELVLIESATPSINNDLEWAENIRDVLPVSSKIVFAGTHVSAMGEGFLSENSNLDYLILGEYELVLRELARSLRSGKSPHAIPGVVYRDKEGMVMASPRKEGVANLDDLPWPERLTLPIYNYNDAGSQTPNPTVQIMASRGCPYGCVYCLWPQLLYGNKKYRTRKISDVVLEMEMLAREYGFKGVYFDDDTFNIGKERILSFCKEIKKRELHLPWSIMARADASDQETLKAMRDAGLVAIKFGVESGSQKLVDGCGKGLMLNKVAEAVGYCKKLGIKVHLTFTFGLPGESKESIEQTIKYALELDPDSAQFSLTTPFPGTEYFRILKEKKLLVSEDWKKYDGSRYAILRGEGLSSRDLEAAVKRARQVWAGHCQDKDLERTSLNAVDRNAQPIIKPLARIALVDLMFTWPPKGGASQDINGVASGLVKKGFDLQMFVPFYDKLFVRGQVDKPLDFSVQQLYFKKESFLPEIIAERLRDAVDCFDPDYVMIGDGWSLKPYIVDALKGYKTFLRFYAYENLCLIRNGLLLKDDRPCSYNFIVNREQCLECVSQRMLNRGSGDEGIKEFLLSHGFSARYHELVKKTLGRVQGIIVYNQIIAKMLSGINKNVFIVPSGVDTGEFSPAAKHNSNRAVKHIFMAGRVEDRAKGLHVLEKACEKLWRKRKDFLVTITGSREIDVPYFRSSGWVSFEELPKLYRHADICVFPSIWHEPFGIAAVEAMACGKPVIASRVGGLRQIVVEGETGFFVEPGNADDLADKIEILLDNSGLRDSMGRMGRKRAEQLYNWDKIVNKYYLRFFK